MLNAQSKLFKLQEIIKNKDSLGCDILTYTDVCLIGVTIHKHHKSNTTQDGLIVNTATYNGMTRYNSFDECKEYRIVSEKDSYAIKSAINGRWSQLQLEVMCHE
ncbi:MAG: hypothetical protein ACRCX8_10320 [Sarcina sp.]